ncbi:MAG: carbohydrate binding domain-containing protein [Clostridia bacterium]|nr:carbohydrate binding domain-containing protein [Clostridia bacterium]
MQMGSSIWLHMRSLRRIAFTVLFFFIFNILSMNLSTLPWLNRNVGTPVAAAAVADRDGLGMESFWSYLSKDLGAGWKYSVNTFTGDLVLQQNLVSIPGRGTGLQEGLTYNSLSALSGVIGTGWQLSNDLYIQENADSSVTFKDGDATNHRFTSNGVGGYNAPAGVSLKLTKVSAGVFNLTDLANTVIHFENDRLVSVTDEKGNATTLTYDASNRLSRINDASGRALTYGYDLTTGKLTTITDPANRTVSFGYDGAGRLTSVTDAKGGVTGFSYDASGKLAFITDANSHKTSFFYNAEGKVNKITDARTTQTREYATTLTYDTVLLKTTVTDPANKSVTFTHNANGNLTQLQDGAGVTVSYTWAGNELTNINDANGSTSAAYDSNGNITQITDTLNAGSNATTTAGYDARNNPTQVTDPNGNQVNHRYDGQSNLLSSANPLRREADANTYDAYGNLTSKTEVGAPTYNVLENGSFEFLDGLGNPNHWSYWGTASAISIDNTTAFFAEKSLKISSLTSTYAAAAQYVQVTPGQQFTLSVPFRMQNVSGTGGVDIGLEFYDANWNYMTSTYSDTWSGSGDSRLVVTNTAPAGAVYAYVVLELWNASGTVWFDGAQLEKPIDTNEGNIITEFDNVENSSFENGLNYWFTGGNGTVSLTTEAAWGGSNSVKASVSSPGSMAYMGSAFIPIRSGDPFTVSGFIKTVNHTGFGAVIQVHFYDRNNTYLGLADMGKQTGTQDFTRYAKVITPPAGTTSVVLYGVNYGDSGTAYFDNIKLTTSSTTTLEYDAAGNYATAVTDPLGNRTDFGYDSAGNRTMVDDAKGNITYFGYDALNNLTSVTDPLGKVFRFGYDPVSLQVAYRDGRSLNDTDNTYRTLFGYNELNQITSVTDPLNRTLSNSYDDSSNLSATTLPDGKQVLYAYDAANHLTQKRYSSEATQYNFSYDTASNLQQVTDNLARSYIYSFDKANRLTSATDLFGYRQDFGLDNAGNITSITDSNGKSTSYLYSSTNKLLYLTTPLGYQVNFIYDEAGRPFRIFRNNGYFAHLRYDRAGRVSEIADSGNPGGAKIQYYYDANGNITGMTSADGYQSFSYDALNRLTGWTDEFSANTTYTYDAVGNLTQKGSRTFTYNAANEITNQGFTYDTNGNLTSDGNFNYAYDGENRLVRVTRVSDGSTVATYEYDYRGLRISKTTASGTIRYHWDDKERLVRESDTNGNTLALYIYDDKGQLQAIEKGGAIYYTHTNHRGDILSVTDISGNRVATYKYDPWGKLISQTGTFDQPFRYAGYYYDSETGIYYLKARYYSPELGRFLNKDTFKGLNEDPQTLNLYVYASGNPIKYTDPSGHGIKTKIFKLGLRYTAKLLRSDLVRYKVIGFVEEQLGKRTATILSTHALRIASLLESMSRWEDIFLNEIQHQVVNVLISQGLSRPTAVNVGLGVKMFVEKVSWLFL